MKKFFAFLFLGMLLISCSKAPVIEGKYKYDVNYSNKIIFTDLKNSQKEFKNYSSGEITLYWELKEEPQGKYILIEKSEGNDSSYQQPLAIELKKSDFYTDQVQKSGQYFFKISKDETFLYKYSINIPDFFIYYPTPKDTNVSAKGLTFYFKKVDQATKYVVTLLDNTYNPIWSMETADTQITYSGDKLLETGKFYTLTVSTEILSDSVNKINLVSESQFPITK